ncbi:cyclic AMP-responsive element-binding protein 1-like isoform X2 [Anneissia japonica]|uniref:cyclic AMP-responsive element-binding protein 1-like isoform X2 n=1 Tax=Anneissia japonica TaxID=1529436 RepID=UPI0014259394|nr:cyclic AMP-responsive element-binding protein 1-like isoform X2 [Anneissia japonica]
METKTEAETVHRSQESEVPTGLQRINTVTQAVPVSVVMSSIPNASVQVQSVLQQGNQPSVIQATPLPTVQVQVAQVEEEGGGVHSDVERRKRQEILSRRPSYRKILNDLSSDAPGVAKIEEEPEDTESATLTAASLQNFPAVSGVTTIQIANHPENMQGLQTLTMTNANGTPAGTIVQSIQTQDGQQFFVPTATGDVQAYQIRPATSLPQGVVMATQANISATQQNMADEASRKRELRLYKNREAARECRRKKKEYIKCLESRVAVLENQNKTLIEELKSLKELYCHKAEDA